MPKRLSIIVEDRLSQIPTKYWDAHQFCFHLHDQMVHMLIEYEASGAHNAVLDTFRKAIRGREKEFEDVDLLAFLKTEDLFDAYKHHILSHTILALTADMLHFLFEALQAFEKRKFSVGFSLLRKPLKEHLLFLSWILADDLDFMRRFASDTAHTLSTVSRERRVEILSKAIDRLAISEMFDPELIWEMVYSKHHVHGFEPTWQRATHLVTSMGELLRTEDHSLNFIFHDPIDDSYYDFLYVKLPYLLIYLIQLLLELFGIIHVINRNTYSHLVLTTMGCYESLFVDGSSQLISKMLNSHMGELLTCSHCDARFRITKTNALCIYITEQVKCKSCGLVSPIPLYWLLAKAKVNLKKNE